MTTIKIDDGNLKPFISEDVRESKKARWKELLRHLLKVRL